MIRKTMNGFVAFLTLTAMLLAAHSSAQAGPGWCYWHPYACEDGE
jgi:hypothetical protein